MVICIHIDREAMEERFVVVGESHQHPHYEYCIFDDSIIDQQELSISANNAWLMKSRENGWTIACAWQQDTMNRLEAVWRAHDMTKNWTARFPDAVRVHEFKPDRKGYDGMFKISPRFGMDKLGGKQVYTGNKQFRMVMFEDEWYEGVPTGQVLIRDVVKVSGLQSAYYVGTRDKKDSDQWADDLPPGTKWKQHPMSAARRELMRKKEEKRQAPNHNNKGSSSFRHGGNYRIHNPTPPHSHHPEQAPPDPKDFPDIRPPPHVPTPQPETTPQNPPKKKKWGDDDNTPPKNAWHHKSGGGGSKKDDGNGPTEPNQDMYPPLRHQEETRREAAARARAEKAKAAQAANDLYIARVKAEKAAKEAEKAAKEAQKPHRRVLTPEQEQRSREDITYGEREQVYKNISQDERGWVYTKVINPATMVGLEKWVIEEENKKWGTPGTWKINPVMAGIIKSKRWFWDTKVQTNKDYWLYLLEKSRGGTSPASDEKYEEMEKEGNPYLQNKFEAKKGIELGQELNVNSFFF